MNQQMLNKHWFWTLVLDSATEQYGDVVRVRKVLCCLVGEMKLVRHANRLRVVIYLQVFYSSFMKFDSGGGAEEVLNRFVKRSESIQ